MPDLGSVRRRQASVLVVGAAEPEVHPWLHAAGHGTRAVRDAAAARAALAEAPADLIIVDREVRGLDVAGVCRALHDDAQLGEAWMLAITAKGTMADAALTAGADDYLHRPFTRGELLARLRTGLRAVRQRSDDRLMRTLMVNVPGAIYRSAWHAGHALELISDEIERISGYPPANFVASARRTLISIIHPDDRDRVMAAVAEAGDHEEPFVLEYRVVRADGEVRWVLDRGQMVPGPGGRLWMDGAIFDITERRAAEDALRRHEIEQARTEELRASRVRIVQAADAARKKIERDLHDGAQQRLVLASLALKRAQALARDTPAEPTVQEAFEQVREGLAELRDLAHGIHPAVLSDHGLAAALEGLVARSPVPVELHTPRARAAADVEAAIYFTVAEALTNVAKYARASMAHVHVDVADGAVVAEVVDDGIGGASTAAGSGLRGLADRLDALDGTLSVDSPPGAGTTVRARVPLPPAGS
ncbi:MAG TPA: PAS domain-containing protein [Solirubrobacteraceae bacterium]